MKESCRMKHQNNWSKDENSLPIIFGIWAKYFLFSVKRKAAPLSLYYLSGPYYTELDSLSLEKRLVCTLHRRIQPETTMRAFLWYWSVWKKHELSWSTRCFVYTILSFKIFPLYVGTWCHIDETLGWIIEFFSLCSDICDILKQLKKYSVQSSEGGNREAGDKRGK